MEIEKMARENFSIGAFYNITNKSSAVAEMGGRGHNRHGPKRGGAAMPLMGGGDGLRFSLSLIVSEL